MTPFVPVVNLQLKTSKNTFDASNFGDDYTNCIIFALAVGANCGYSRSKLKSDFTNMFNQTSLSYDQRQKLLSKLSQM